MVDTDVAKKTLSEFEDTLKTLLKNREVIVKTIEQIDKGLA